VGFAIALALACRASAPTLPAARHALATRISAPADTSPPPTPPDGILETVHYPGPLGDYVAYVTPARSGPGPAVVWIAGGFDWGIGSGAWEDQPRENDQSARAFREAGIATMYPALRGSNGNPGHNECFLGEVDDILAAIAWLKTRPDVDPERVYLGGHSTGGTLALLAAESTPGVRAVFASGPVADPRIYGSHGCLPANVPPEEWSPRAPEARRSGEANFFGE
jgi:dipeptidyl aminopeptidase/acylaminoacyl peptidase